MPKLHGTELRRIVRYKCILGHLYSKERLRAYCDVVSTTLCGRICKGNGVKKTLWERCCEKDVVRYFDQYVIWYFFWSALFYWQIFVSKNVLPRLGALHLWCLCLYHSLSSLKLVFGFKRTLTLHSLQNIHNKMFTRVYDFWCFCSPWEIVRCQFCGSSASHWKCNAFKDKFTCKMCTAIRRKSKFVMTNSFFSVDANIKNYVNYFVKIERGMPISGYFFSLISNE